MPIINTVSSSDAIFRTTAPDNTVEGFIGQECIVNNKDVYKCMGQDDNGYIWKSMSVKATSYYAICNEKPNMFTDLGIYTEETIPDDLTHYTVMFYAPVNYTAGAKVAINDETYTLKSMNGKSLPDNAWVENALVTLNVDPIDKKAFFNLGGADLSFITAEAEHIQEGYVGSDIEGNPINGSLTPKKVAVIMGEVLWTLSNNNKTATPGASFVLPDFDPDAVSIYWQKYTLNANTGTDNANSVSRQSIWWDKVHQLAIDANTFETLNDTINLYHSSAAGKDFASFPYSFTANSVLTIYKPTGYIASNFKEGSGYAIMYAFKF